MAWASAARIRTVFAAVDRNGDRKLSFEEFRKRPEEAWFAQLDLNEDAHLTYDEFAAGYVALVRDGRCPLVFAAFDRNGDGSLNLEEYVSKPAEAHFHIKDADADGDGFVSFEEYTSAGGQGA